MTQKGSLLCLHQLGKNAYKSICWCNYDENILFDLPINLGRSLSSRQTAKKNSSEDPFLMAPSGIVKLTPKRVIKGTKVIALIKRM